ncbi:glycosyltransferase [Mesorhizobium sp. B1-1-8]|uniref:glycosyltransferase n=1 Tax=Mesorhizobium sp. B1-1-8 TaxID=2589976 RepID=UPI001D01DB29|nr:glycosyltransferase [Mesorhizobium sp. B1-1-8]UCI10300.1 glycosyltransferase [Mesorhizobium sp. B1-1-8]
MEGSEQLQADNNSKALLESLSVRELFERKVGKTADKWDHYLPVYQDILQPVREERISLLEIGVQNGGSLEVWASFLPRAEAIIGTDIDAACGELVYDDPRIRIVVGDSTDQKTAARIFDLSPTFDVIIDDGSHRSRDIVKSFCLYFPRLTDGGIYIVEDLHCSYWEQFEGGLFYPYSPMTFFKYLSDCINHQHWGIGRDRKSILAGILNHCSSDIDDPDLSQIYSIEFTNSMCIVRKRKALENQIGRRIISGSESSVQPVDRSLIQATIIFDQSTNAWSMRDHPPAEELMERLAEIERLKEEVRQQVEAGVAATAAIEKVSNWRLSEIMRLEKAAADEAPKRMRLQSQLADEQQKLAATVSALAALKKSRSWRLTKPLRAVGAAVRQIGRAIPLVRPAMHISRAGLTAFRRGGWRGVEDILLNIDTDAEYRARVQEATGLSPAAAWPLRFVARRYFASKRLVGRLACLDPSTMTRRLAAQEVYFHIDEPIWRLSLLRDTQAHVSGWAFDANAQKSLPVRVTIAGQPVKAVSKIRPDVVRAFEATLKSNIACGFAAERAVGFGLHRLVIELQLEDGHWVRVSRSLVLRVPGRRKSIDSPTGEVEWRRVLLQHERAENNEFRRDIRTMLERPLFSVVIDARDGEQGLDETLKSLANQIYQASDILIWGGNEAAGALPTGVARVASLNVSDLPGDFFVLMRPGDELSESGLYHFASALNHTPSLDLIYCDEQRASSEPAEDAPIFYKPDWSPDYLEATDYIGRAACYRKARAASVLETLATGYDLNLRFTEGNVEVKHISKVLMRTDKAVPPADPTRKQAADAEALTGRLARTGRPGVVRPHPKYDGCYLTELHRDNFPLVSIIIPTAGRTVRVGAREIDLIMHVVRQIRHLSSYPNLEIVVVDNGDLTPGQIAALDAAGCIRVTYSNPVFNVAEKLNLGSSKASGEFLLLLNDDIEIINEDWIERMLDQLAKPGVGVVGARLLYPNGLTQHVGVVHNYSNPDHVRRGYAGDEAGYFFSTCGARNYLAVTGACMMTRAGLFRQVGGYTEALAVSFNDVDYCLKVRQLGFRTVYAPQASLTHMESMSREAFADPNELEYFRRRWAKVLTQDSFYNERFLSVNPPTFQPSFKQRML